MYHDAQQCTSVFSIIDVFSYAWSDMDRLADPPIEPSAWLVLCPRQRYFLKTTYDHLRFLVI